MSETDSKVCVPPAMFRAVRALMGVENEWLAQRWEVGLRSVERWQSTTTMPAGCAEDLLKLHEDFASLVFTLIEQAEAGTPLIVFRRAKIVPGTDMPAGFWNAAVSVAISDLIDSGGELPQVEFDA